MRQNSRVSQYEYYAGPYTVTPSPTLSLFDAIALIIGLVVGAGIFRTLSLVVANAGSATAILWAWVLGLALPVWLI